MYSRAFPHFLYHSAVAGFETEDEGIIVLPCNLTVILSFDDIRITLHIQRTIEQDDLGKTGERRYCHQHILFSVYFIHSSLRHQYHRHSVKLARRAHQSPAAEEAVAALEVLLLQHVEHSLDLRSDALTGIGLGDELVHWEYCSTWAHCVVPFQLESIGRGVEDAGAVSVETYRDITCSFIAIRLVLTKNHICFKFCDFTNHHREGNGVGTILELVKLRRVVGSSFLVRQLCHFVQALRCDVLGRDGNGCHEAEDCCEN